MSLHRVVTFVHPDPTHATITWEYNVRRFMDEGTFQIGQVTLRVLVKKDLNNDNMFNLTWKIVLCPPGSTVHYRVETIIPEEEGHPASMYPPIVEGTLSDTQRHCSLLLGTNNRQRSLW